MPNKPFHLALLTNMSLLGLFAVQHSVMARSWFKNWLTSHIPESAERATYVLFSNIAMILLFAYWEPMGGIIWQIESKWAQQLVMTSYILGWITVLIATFLINHFELFGLAQPWNRISNNTKSQPKLIKPFLYKFVRHPIYLGWLIIFWSAQTMTLAHLVFSLMCTAYVFVGIYFEEIDLIGEFSSEYAEYQKDVPMIIPFTKAK